MTYSTHGKAKALINRIRKAGREVIEQFNRILDFRKDVDPGLLEVDDAKQRLAGLERE